MGTNIDYRAVAHQTILTNITGGSGGSPLGDTGWGWGSIAAKLQTVQDDVVRAIQGIGAAQQGAAADAATRATMPLAPWVTELADIAKSVSSRISVQAEYFAHTLHNMPPERAIPDVSWSQDPGEAAADVFLDWLPGAQTDEERVRALAQQDEQRAQDLMIAYQANSNENLTASQGFTAPPTVVADVAEPSLRGGSVGGPGGYPSPAGAGAGGPAAGTASQLAVAAPQAAVTPPQFVGGYPDQGAQHGSGSGQVRPGAPAAFGPPPGVAGAGPGGDRSRAGSRYPDAAGRGAGGAGGTAGRGGGFGPRPAGGTAPSGGTAPPGGGFGPSGSGADAVRGGAEQGGAGRGAAAGARGAAGAGVPPFGAPGGGRGSGADDIERRRPSYLIEHDVNAIVGELPPTAPPVIGADEYP